MRRPSAVSRLLTRLLQGFVVLCLIGGFLDLVYPPIAATKLWLVRNIPPPPVTAAPGSVEDVIRMRVLPYRYLPSLGRVLTTFEAPGLHIDANGMRSNGTPSPASPRATGYVLGSSQAFGFNIRDEQTLSAHLEHALQDVRIENYSGLNKSLPETVMRWQELTQQGGKPDFVVIVDGMISLSRDCFMQQDQQDEKRSTIFGYLYDTFRSKKGETVYHCQSENGAEQAVAHALYEVQSAIEYGRRQKTPFLLIIPPYPWVSGLNTSNLAAEVIPPQHRQMMESVYARLFEKLQALNAPELIDLSRVLPADQPYMLDKGGHLSGNGNRILAAGIADVIKARQW